MAKSNCIKDGSPIEAIIDTATWEKTQELLKRRTRTPDLHTNKSIFAGFLKCGDCGRSLSKKTEAAKPGNARIRYYCGTYVRSGRQYCTPHPVSHALLEKIILEDLRAILQHTDNLREIVQKGLAAAMAKERAMEQASHAGTAQISTQLDKVRKQKQAAYEDYREGLLSKEEFIAYRQDYIKKENLLAEQLGHLKGQPDSGASGDISGNPWIMHLLETKSMDRLERAAVVEMIHRIEIYEDHKIKIIYNFSDFPDGPENHFASHMG